MTRFRIEYDGNGSFLIYLEIMTVFANKPLT